MLTNRTAKNSPIYKALEAQRSQCGLEVSRSTAIVLQNVNRIHMTVMKLHKELLYRLETLGQLGYSVAAEVGYDQRVHELMERLKQLEVLQNGR
jgi:hypothetical protein